MRFPLIVLVVSIHVPVVQFVNEDLLNYTTANFFYRLTACGIARIAVPLFFFISGFLFFYKTEWSKSAYIKKIKKRLFTLVIPYVLWCTVALCYTYFAWLFKLTKNAEFSGLSIWSWLNFYAGINGDPINLPFWFIRDLFCVGLLSPIWYFLIKKLKLISMLVIALAWFFSGIFIPQISCLSFVAIFFFCFGAYFSIHKKDFIQFFSKFGGVCVVAYSAILLINIFYENFYLHQIGILLGIVVAIYIASLFLKKKQDFRIPEVVSNSTFFILGAHMFFVLLPRVLFQKFPLESSWSIITAYYGDIVFAVTMCILISIALRKIAPWSLKYLTGGR